MDTEVARELAYEEMSKWGLLDQGWTFEFCKAISYAGICYYAPDKLIRLSAPICKIKSHDFILDTIRHEIAHALVGPGHGHDVVWQRAARRVGASTDVTYDECEEIEKLRLSKTKYVMCFENKIVQTYMRKPNRKTLATLSCRWARGFKELTYGKLQIVPYNPRVHIEFLQKEV